MIILHRRAASAPPRRPRSLPSQALPSLLVPSFLLLATVLPPAALSPAAWLSTGTAAAAELRIQTYRVDPVVSAPALPPDLIAVPPAAGDEVLAIVQFDGPITRERRAALAAAADEVLDYLPDFAFLVRVRAPIDAVLTGIDGVRWAGLHQPAFRLSDSIGAAQYINPDRAAAPDYTLVVEAIGRPEAVAATVVGLGGRVIDTTFDGRRHRLLVALPRGRETRLAHRPEVIWIEEALDYRLWNNTTRWVVQSNVSELTPIWERGLHGENRIATIMDSGLDYASCWFRDHGNPPPGPSHRKVIDYTLWGGNPYDGCNTGHGTHVAGTLAGDQSFINTGNIDYNGLAYAAQLSVQDVGLDNFLTCLLGLVSIPTSLVAPFQEAFDLGARVHSNSWGSTTNSYNGHARDVDSFMWDHPDFLIVIAAGNSGPASGTVGSPGVAKSCLTVGASRQAPEQDTVAGYSSRGPAFDGRTKPAVTAPGGESPDFITSADNDPDSVPTCNVVSSPFQGTSMAAPAVAGLALLVQQYFEEGWYPTGAPASGDSLHPSAALVKALLVNAATDMGTADIPNHDEGWGRMLLDDGLYFGGDPRELRIEEHPGVATGETAVFTYDVEAGEPLEITLVWTDFPAAQGAGTAMVNDLDLIVTGPGGTHLGNVMSGGQSVPGGSADRLNVEEVVRLDDPGAGSYTIEVAGFNVPQGTDSGAGGAGQPFALVATGAFASWPPLPGSVAPGASGGPMGGGADSPGVVRRGGFVLHVARPNPFNPAAEIRYEITGGRPAHVRIEIFDAAGRRVRELVSDMQAAGPHRVRWDGRDDRGRALSSGIYHVRLTSGAVRISDKIALLR